MRNTKSSLIFCFILMLPTFIFSQTYYQNISTSAGVNIPGMNRGVSINDFDNDGDEDVYVTVYSGPNLLFRNNSDGTFTNVAGALGVDYSESSQAAVWGDLDNDGDEDLFLGNELNPNILFENNGGTFTDISQTAGIDSSDRVRSLMLSDVDNDGFLDIYIANSNSENILFRNNGDLTFTNIIHESGATDSGFSMGAVFCDYDGDGDGDLYLSHDANQANILYQNDGNGNFTNVTTEANVGYEGLGMGVDFGDADGDGNPDIYITNLYENTLYLSQGDGSFFNHSNTAQITDYGMGWGTFFLDFDNDGRLDIYVINDSHFSPYPNVLYKNLGSAVFGIAEPNGAISSMNAGYGGACFDFNNDGKPDIFVANSGGVGNEFFENITQNPGNYLKVKAEGTVSNRSAIGTKIVVEADGKIFTEEIMGGSGYISQNSRIQHFGIGEATLIDKMTVSWPSGIEEVFENLDINQTVKITENDGITSTNDYSGKADFENAFQIFPTVVSDKLTVRLNENFPKNGTLILTNFEGKILNQFENLNPETQFEIEAGNLPNGVYFISIKTDNQAVTKRFIIKI